MQDSKRCPTSRHEVGCIKLASALYFRSERRRRRSAMQRQLAAILFADVSGYGRLMDTHESDTHSRLMALRAEIIEPPVATNAGQIVKNTGDGFIACCASINSALDAALGMQREIAQRE